MLKDNYKDHISDLVEEAHAIFNKTSVHEIIDSDRKIFSEKQHNSNRIVIVGYYRV